MSVKGWLLGFPRVRLAYVRRVEAMRTKVKQELAEFGGGDEVWHIGRSWTGNPVEQGCPCPKEACGLVDMARAVEECNEHWPRRGKTIRQSHLVEDCPGGKP